MTQTISLVVAMNQERVIGVDNALPWHIPEDLAYFKQVTLNKPIIMGRKTFESIGRVLPKRRNIVISRSGFSYPNVEVFTSLEDALSATSNDAEICIIGGGEIFKQALPYANSLHLTMVDFPVANPSAWFPEVDFTGWECIMKREIISENNIHCEFNHYILSKKVVYNL